MTALKQEHQCNSFWTFVTLLGMKSGYSGSADTSARCNGTNGTTRIKLRENGILLSSRERSYNDSGKE